MRTKQPNKRHASVYYGRRQQTGVHNLDANRSHWRTRQEFKDRGDAQRAVAQLQSEEEAADWVHKNMPAKNTLIAADADLVESAFKDKLASIQSMQASVEEPAGSVAGDGSATTSDQIFVELMEAPVAAPIIVSQKSEARRRRVAAKTIRLRDKEHCKYVATQPCVVCGSTPSEAHHVRFAQPRAIGRKVSNEYTVPVCRLHHRDLHTYGDEASWWVAVSIDPLPIALTLWRKSRSHLR